MMRRRSLPMWSLSASALMANGWPPSIVANQPQSLPKNSLLSFGSLITRHKGAPALFLFSVQKKKVSSTNGHFFCRYELNTRVQSPHKKAVSALLFQPGKRGDVVVSLSFDGRFKIWNRGEISEQKGAEAKVSSWSCRATGFYRDYMPHDAVFSEDGSILAVSYGQVRSLFFSSLFLHSKLLLMNSYID
jgi:WD40 repeat protein